jgi:serine protease Do
MAPSRREFLTTATAIGLPLAAAGCTTGREDTAPAVEHRTETTTDSTVEEIYQSTIPSVTSIQVGDSGGSGFVYDDYIVTNEHVVDEAETVNVRFKKGDWTTAGVLATDVYSDLAVLSTNIPRYASPLSFVDAIPSIGTDVLALGSPFNLESSVSEGIISGRNRSLDSPSGFSIPNTVQTDAGLDPGNSGGPLVTLTGEVAGVAVAGAGTSVGFAVSPLLARRVLPELIENKTYTHPYLGISLMPVSPAIAEANDLDEVSGIYVFKIRDDGPPGQPLEGATDTETINGESVPVGGDTLISLAGDTIQTPADLGTTLALKLSPGDRVNATVIRDGTEQDLTVAIGERPPPDDE